MRTCFTVLCLPATLSACVAPSAAASIQRHATSKPTGADQQQQQHGTDAAHLTVFLSSLVLVLIRFLPLVHPPLLPPTAATRCLRSTLFSFATARRRWCRFKLRTQCRHLRHHPFVCTCETEVVPLQHSHATLPPPSLAPPSHPTERRCCWNWVSKRDTRASIPSLASMVFSSYVFFTRRRTLHCLVFIILHRARSRARVLIVLCSITPYLGLVWRCGAFILFSFYFVSFHESPLSRLASQRLSRAFVTRF
jgi:hypothetical protein